MAARRAAFTRPELEAARERPSRPAIDDAPANLDLVIRCRPSESPPRRVMPFIGRRPRRRTAAATLVNTASAGHALAYASRARHRMPVVFRRSSRSLRLPRADQCAMRASWEAETGAMSLADTGPKLAWLTLGRSRAAFPALRGWRRAVFSFALGLVSVAGFRAVPPLAAAVPDLSRLDLAARRRCGDKRRTGATADWRQAALDRLVRSASASSSPGSIGSALPFSSKRKNSPG